MHGWVGWGHQNLCLPYSPPCQLLVKTVIPDSHLYSRVNEIVKIIVCPKMRNISSRKYCEFTAIKSRCPSFKYLPIFLMMSVVILLDACVLCHTAVNTHAAVSNEGTEVMLTYLIALIFSLKKQVLEQYVDWGLLNLHKPLCVHKVRFNFNDSTLCSKMLYRVALE